MDAGSLRSLPYNWGGTAGEWATAYHCDELARPGSDRLIRAVSVAAQPDTVYAWLGNLRVAPYSYDLVDNFGRRSPRSLDASLPALAAGQRVMMIFDVVRVRPPGELTLRMRAGLGRAVFGDVLVTYAVEPVGEGSRLVAVLRWDAPAGPLLRLRRTLLAWGDLLMMRKQLLTLAARADHTERAGSR